MFNQIRHLASRSAPFVGMSAFLFGAFELLICKIVSTIDIEGTVRGIMQALPATIRTMVADQFVGGTRQDLMAFGWNHPLVHALGAAVAIVLGARAIAGEIDGGAVELLLSQPISRHVYYTAHAIHGIGALALITASGILGTSLGQTVFDVPMFEAGTLARLAANYWLLLVAWFAITIAISAFGRENGPVAMAGFFMALVSFLIRVIGTIWSRVEPALPFTLYSYYEPRSILVQQARDAGDLVVLATVAAIAFAIGAVRFSRRDLP